MRTKCWKSVKIKLSAIFGDSKNNVREVFNILERCPWSLHAWVLKQYQGLYQKTDIFQLPFRRCQPFSFTAVARYHHNSRKHQVLWHVTGRAHSRLSLCGRPENQIQIIPECSLSNSRFGKVSAQPHTIVKQLPSFFRAVNDQERPI